MIFDYYRMLTQYLQHDYVAYNHPRPRRAKRNKQTNKKKSNRLNFRRR